MIELIIGVDMIRLRMPFSEYRHSDYLKLIDNDIASNYYTSLNINKYRHNWIISHKDTKKNIDAKLWVGLKFNREKKNEETITFEWNPNKLSFKEITNLGIRKLLQYAIKHDNLEIMSFDINMDIPSNIDNFIIYNTKQGDGHLRNRAGHTKYYGAKSTNGYTKFYNKALEKGLQGELTRYEITYKPTLIYDDVEQIKAHIDKTKQVEIYQIHEEKLKLNKNDRFMLNAIEHKDYPGTLNDVSRRKKEKFKELLELDNKKISISSPQALNAYLEIIQSIKDELNTEKIIINNLSQKAITRMNENNEYYQFMKDKDIFN